MFLLQHLIPTPNHFVNPPALVGELDFERKVLMRHQVAQIDFWVYLGLAQNARAKTERVQRTLECCFCVLHCELQRVQMLSGICEIHRNRYCAGIQRWKFYFFFGQGEAGFPRLKNVL